MSHRWQIGDRVRLAANTGFVRVPCDCLIPDLPENHEHEYPFEEVCALRGCYDPECNEWPTLWVLGPDGEPNGGMCCHVSDCQLEPMP